MKNKGFLCVGLGLSVSLYLIIVFFEIDLYEKIETATQQLEQYEIDELIIPIFIFSVFTLIYMFGQVKKSRLESEKAKIYMAMLSSTYHILNNLLNQLKLYQMTAKETKGFNPEVLEQFDKTIEEAVDQIVKLSSISKIDEASIKTSVGTKE